MEHNNEQVKIYLMGSFNMIIGDTKIAADSWKSKKALTLFKYIITRKQKTHKDILIDLIWPDCNQDQTHNLHTIIYYIRKLLKSSIGKPCDFIKYSKGLYWFDKMDICWLDCEEMELQYKKGVILQKQEKEFNKAIEAYDKVINLYQGDFLQDDLYKDWTFTIRDYYRDIYIDAVIRYSDILAEKFQNYMRALEICQQGLKIDPYREELHKSIISYLLKLGMYIEATRQYQEYTRMLYEEFGLKPGPEVNDMFLESTKHKKNVINIFGNKEERTPGPFICDKQTFEIIYELMERQQRRSNEEFTLMRIVNNNCNYKYQDSKYHDNAINDRYQHYKDQDTKHIMRVVFSCLQNCLRRGDVLCNWDNKAFMVLIFALGEEKVGLLKERVSGVFNTQGINSLDIEIAVIKPTDQYRELNRMVN